MTLRVPARYRLRDGAYLDLRRLPLADRLCAAWLIESMRSGTRPEGILTALADEGPRARPLARIAHDLLASVTARGGARAAASAGGAEGAHDHPSDYRSVSEAARALGISRAAVVQAIHERRLLAHRFG